MITANQLYKQSNSSIPFKEWLKETQKQGMLDNHEKMYNLIEGEVDEEVVDGESDESQADAPKNKTATTNKANTTNSNQMRNIIALVGVCFLIYGLTQAKAN
jgi:hypothetical protein